MTFISIFNDVLGPVMRGPSSSHTAGSYRIARLARSLFSEAPARAKLTFDPRGSYAQTFRQQGADLAFVVGFLDRPLTDDRFREMLDIADAEGLDLSFAVESLPGAEHPNTVRIELEGGGGSRCVLTAESTGGGGVRIREIEGFPVEISGKTGDVFVWTKKESAQAVVKILSNSGPDINASEIAGKGDEVLVAAYGANVPPEGSCGGRPFDDLKARLASLPGVRSVRVAYPVFFVRRGDPPFSSGADMIAFAEAQGKSLGEAAIAYESAVLGLSEAEILAEMAARFEVMRMSVKEGLAGRGDWMQQLRPTAAKILEAEKKGTLPAGGLHTRAAARAMAVMHMTNSAGIVCAAPTGGSAGTLPGVAVTLAEDMGFPEDRVLRALFAASAAGLIIAQRATFAAEVAGCQVEIGAAGAMAAAAVVEAAGGTARQAADAAAIALQNTMGSVCDLVQGACEIPCHTRNAAAAASAFVCADLILGGYDNPIPLDETVDASLASGRMLPSELRCTSRGGIAVAPSALALPSLRAE
ncbi:MAG: L-serine ammonia-lyase, iron-sulfur-dependent, subunit alpha [Acidobacteriota bacterium]|nr:L-serine ammonia-lyase, iron-sulfur-dependent, subunit alpha [Acidobacteriota bacterium]